MSILPAHLSRTERRMAIRNLERANAAQPSTMTEVPADLWPAAMVGVVLRFWRSQRFLAQLHPEPKGIFRLSVNRTTTRDGARWDDGITWDELQAVKNECGFASAWAVEVCPPLLSVVDVANMRHLWLLSEAPTFAWKKP
jgi:hypothetical protein